MARIVYIAGREYGRNDTNLPIVLALASQGHKTTVVFLDHKAWESVGGHGAWRHWLEDLTRLVRLEPDWPRSPLDHWKRRLRGARLFLPLGLTPGQIVFLPDKSAPYAFARFFDRFHNAWHTRGVSSAFIDEEREHCVTHVTTEQWAMMGKGKELSTKKPKVRSVVAQNMDEMRIYDTLQYRNLVLIPAPHMQPWWKRFMQEHPPHFDHPKVAAAKEIILMLVLRKGNYIFAPGADVDVLIDDIIRAVRKEHPDTLIVLKPKYQKGGYFLTEEMLREKYGDENIIIAYEPITVLARKAILSFSTGESSAEYYVLSCGVPVIEYCRYSEEYKKIYPRMTPVENWGGRYVSTREDLASAIAEARGRRADVEFIKRKINFAEIPLSADLFIPKK